jgi:hypothetical protein
MPYDLIKDLERVERFKILFNIERYFNFIEKCNETVAVPFYISATKLNKDCIHMFVDKLKGENTEIFYCNEDEYITQYAATGAKLVSCNSCPFYKRKK